MTAKEQPPPESRSRKQMAKNEPVAEQPFDTDFGAPAPWPEARARLAEAQTYWLATVRPDGRPHVTPLLGVWVDGALHFVANATSRKARNLAHDAHCVITAGNPLLDLVVEGEAAKVSDDATLQRVANVYASKYGWEVTVRNGAFDADGAPTAGPPPYEVYEVTPTTIFAFGTDETVGSTRWRFS
jgi:nitroimidazol reductase NimA-like FMN-containing flavoprotein (pyridoxamine 5'-phosphate oxidase superfamily)